MAVQRKRYSAEEKTRVAIEAIKGQKTLNELAAAYGMHPKQITQGKKHASFIAYELERQGLVEGWIMARRQPSRLNAPPSCQRSSQRIEKVIFFQHAD